MSHILLVTFSLCLLLGINQSINAGEFEDNPPHELTNHFMSYTQAVQNFDADTINFSPSVSILSHSETYDDFEYYPWPTFPSEQIGINSQWQLSTKLSINSYFQHQRHTIYSLEYASNHPATERLQENASGDNEYTLLGSEVIMHQLLSNKLIIGVNYQMTLPLFEQSNTSNQQLRTYMNYQLIENLNLHLDWMISSSTTSSPQNPFTPMKLSKQKNVNEIYSQFILFSVSYKM